MSADELASLYSPKLTEAVLSFYRYGGPFQNEMNRGQWAFKAFLHMFKYMFVY